MIMTVYLFFSRIFLFVCCCFLNVTSSPTLFSVLSLWFIDNLLYLWQEYLLYIPLDSSIVYISLLPLLTLPWCCGSGVCHL